MSDKPLPCPFCGEAVEVKRWRDIWIVYGIRCENCGAHPDDSFHVKTPEEALLAWNRRSTPSPEAIEEARKALKRIAEFCEEYSSNRDCDRIAIEIPGGAVDLDLHDAGRALAKLGKEGA